jgi:class 3 adenylate cyclase/tetratricopeptide (TPR) repeat protein
MEGERKQVTVLFADMKGSMELLADRDPEEARKILDPVLELMMEAIHRYEGTVNQVMGDGIMALFGAPLACEDHAVRACYAGLRMQDAAKRYAARVRQTEGIAIQIRVGLNSGDVVVRSIQNDLHMEYTAVGRTTHIAARMEQMAVPGAVLLSEQTLALSAGYVEVNSLGPLPVKGLEAPLKVYELTGAAMVRSRFHAAAARGLTRFVGRDAEIEQLRQALERARAGHGQVVAVVGEAGVGKSRLYWEFSHVHRGQGWLVVESGSVSYGKATNYLPIIELLRAYFAIESADEPRQIHEKVTGKLLSLDRQLEPWLSPMLWLLDVPVEDERWERLDPPQRRQRILDGVKRLLLRESQVQPLIVMFEDLHWIDAETQAMLDSLVESLPTARMLLLVNYRPEYTHGWGNKTYYRQLQIDPLPSESAEVLLDAMLGGDITLTPLKRLVIDRTEGNPFFIEETVRSVLEMGVLAGERGAYRLTRVVQDLQVPATAQAMLATRIDRLAPQDKRLLQAAAVIGTDVPFELLRAIADEPEDLLRPGLAQLQATEFLYETRLFPDLEYTFRHALTHEVAYGSLLAERRRTLHAQILGAIEVLYGDRLNEQVERLAHHAVRGEIWEKAVVYLRQAGAKAAGRWANREALAYFKQALATLAHLPESRETIERAVDLRFDLRIALHWLGEFGQILDHLDKAEALAEGLGDQRRLERIARYRANHFWRIGSPDRAISAGQRALAISTALGDSGLQAAGILYLSGAYHAQGIYQRAMELLRQNIASLTGDLLYERFGQTGPPSVFTRVYLAWCLAECGQFAEGMAYGEEAVQIAELVDHPYSLTAAFFSVGLVSLRKGDLRQAIPTLERGLALCRNADALIWLPWGASTLGYTYALVGRFSEGIPLLEHAVERATSMTMMVEQSLRLAWLGKAHLLAGRTQDAVSLARRALDLARVHGERGYEAYALRLFGEIDARSDPPAFEDATQHLQQAMVLAEELGMRPLVAHCHLGLGTLSCRMSKHEQARKHLTTAATMYRGMEMRSWLEQAEMVMAALS